MFHVVINKTRVTKVLFLFYTFYIHGKISFIGKGFKTDRDRLFSYFFDKQKDASAGTPRKRPRITGKLWL